MSIDSGVCWAGLTTIVQPAAMAGPILRVPMARGKFHGVMSRHGADRLLHGQQAALAVGGDGVAPVDAYRLLGEPAQELGAVGDLGLGLLERLAHLERHQQGQVVGALDDRLKGAAQDLAALARRVLGPVGSGLHGGVERRLGVGLGGVGDLAQRLARGGILDRQGALLAVAPLAADVQLLAGPGRRCAALRRC